MDGQRRALTVTLTANSRRIRAACVAVTRLSRSRSAEYHTSERSIRERIERISAAHPDALAVAINLINAPDESQLVEVFARLAQPRGVG